MSLNEEAILHVFDPSPRASVVRPNGPSRFRRKTRSRATAVAGSIAACLVLLGGVVAFADIPGIDGVIHGCYSKSSGSLRVIDSAATCKGSETRISWNETGPQGPQGAEGAKGDVGEQGEPGAPGPAGADGAAGPSGSQGEQGPAGPMGLTGTQGEQGATGPQGGPGISGWETIQGPTVQINAFESSGALAHCSPGKLVLGGGFSISGGIGDAVLTRSEPLGTNEAWRAQASHRGTGSSPIFLTAHAVCAFVS